MMLAGIARARKHLVEAIRRMTFPLPEDADKQGFEPNLYIRLLRKAARTIILVFRLNGANRFSNEFVQLLDPKLTVTLPGRRRITFRTGHGRLLWRARTFMDQEPLLISWIDRFDPQDCFYDVGANVGCYSLYAAGRGIRTFAFEPELNNLQLLYDNIFLNHVQDKCTPIPIALGSATTSDVFYLKSISKGDALHCVGRKSYLIDNPSDSTPTFDALVMKLDDLVETFGLPRPTRMKIDVDYNELKVIQGAARTLDHVKELYVELDLELSEHQEALRFLEDCSFQVVQKKEETRRKWNPGVFNYLLAKRP